MTDGERQKLIWRAAAYHGNMIWRQTLFMSPIYLPSPRINRLVTPRPHSQSAPFWSAVKVVLSLGHLESTGLSSPVALYRTCNSQSCQAMSYKEALTLSVKGGSG